MKLSKQVFKCGALQQRGAALIVTLLVLMLLVVVVTGFLSTTRVEQMAARNYTFRSAAEQMAMVGVQRAIVQLNAALTNFNGASSIISQPGRIIVDDTTNFLSSAAVPGVTGGDVYLNESQVIHTNTDTSLFRAPLVNISNTSGQVVGRYAFWIDDEGTKANLNAMGSTPRGSFLPTNARSFDYSAIGTANVAPFGNTISNNPPQPTNPWPYFFSGKQIGLLLGGAPPSTAVDYLHFVAGGIPNQTNPPPLMTNSRLNLNTLLPATTSGGALFQRNFLTNSATASVLSDIDAVIATRIDRPAVTDKFGAGFESKYTRDILRQILANINDWPLAAGTTNSPGITGLTGSALVDAEGLPSHVLGLRRFIHLNEVAVRAGFTTNTITGSALELQVWFNVELVNPYNQPWGDAAQVRLEQFGLQFEISYETNGVISTWTTNTPSYYVPGPVGFANIISNVAPATFTDTVETSTGLTRLTFGYEWQVFFGAPPAGIPSSASNISVNNVVVSPGSLKLLQWPDESLTVRDWASASDFGSIPIANTEITEVSTALGFSPVETFAQPRTPPAEISNFNEPGVKGIAKNDPRVRTFSGWPSPSPAWIAVGGASPVTIGANNSVVNYSAGTGLPQIANDSVAPGLASLFGHPSFQSAFTAQNTNESYRSLVDLGRVHTGLQWRTLQMRSQASGESGPPDWALLEAFYISNSLPRINLNSLQQPATTNTMPSPASQAGNGLPRARSLASLFSGGTSANAPAAGLSSSSAFGTGANSALSVAANVAAMNFRPSWAGRRATNSAFPTNAYGLIGEVLEISNVADFNTTNDFINEGRAAAFIDVLTTSSDVFTIYSVGFGVDGAGENVAEYRCRATVRFDRTTGKFSMELLEPLPLP